MYIIVTCRINYKELLLNIELSPKSFWSGNIHELFAPLQQFYTVKKKKRFLGESLPLIVTCVDRPAGKDLQGKAVISAGVYKTFQ